MRYGTNARRPLLLWTLVLFIIAMTGIEECSADTVSATLLSNGKTLTLQVSVADPAPSSLIARLHLPAQAKIVSTSPTGAKVDRKASTIKWLVKTPFSGSLKFSATTATAPDFSSVSGLVLFRHPKDGKLIKIAAQKR